MATYLVCGLNLSHLVDEIASLVSFHESIPIFGQHLNDLANQKRFIASHFGIHVVADMQIDEFPKDFVPNMLKNVSPPSKEDVFVSRGRHCVMGVGGCKMRWKNASQYSLTCRDRTSMFILFLALLSGCVRVATKQASWVCMGVAIQVGLAFADTSEY